MPAWVAPVASAAIGALGSALGGGGGDKFASVKDAYGKHTVGDILGIRDSVLGQPNLEFYGGQTYADLDPAQIDAYNQMINFGQPGGVGGNVLAGQMAQATGGLGAFGGGLDYLSNLQGNQPQFQFDQGTYDTVLSNLMQGLPGQYDAATRDISRDLNWSQIPGLNQAAAMSGNMASSRAGVAEGIMTGMAQDRMADIGANLYTNALNQATNAGFGAGGSNLNAAMGTQGNVLQGFGNFANLGLPGLNAAANTGQGIIDMQLQGGAGFQNQEQLGINEAMSRFDFNQMSPYLTANQQLGVVNQTTPMGMGVGQLPNTPSILDQMMQGGLAGLGMYNAGQQAGWWGGSGGSPTWLDWAQQPGNDPYNIGWGSF